jgi:hypothetical protein
LSNCIIIGEPSTGKTRSLGTLPPKRLILSLDPQGFVALRVPYGELAPGQFSSAAMAELDTLVIDYASAQRQVSGGVDRGSRVSDSGMIYQMLVRDLNAALLSDQVGSIALDGLTGLANVVLEAVMHLNRRSKPNSQADYGDAIEKIVEIVSVCTAARSKNFVLVSHIMLEKDELSGRIKEIPLVFGKQLPNRLLALFESRFQSAFSGDTYFWLTKPTPLMASIGTRLQDNLPERIGQDFTSLFTGNAKPAASLRPVGSK